MLSASPPVLPGNVLTASHCVSPGSSGTPGAASPHSRILTATTVAHPPCRSFGCSPRSTSISARSPRSLHAPAVPTTVRSIANESPSRLPRVGVANPGRLPRSLPPWLPPRPPERSPVPASVCNKRWCDRRDPCRSPTSWHPAPPTLGLTPTLLLSSPRACSSLFPSCYPFSCRFLSCTFESAFYWELTAPGVGTGLLTLSRRLCVS